jgi:hypothetical protein
MKYALTSLAAVATLMLGAGTVQAAMPTSVEITPSTESSVVPVRVPEYWRNGGGCRARSGWVLTNGVWVYRTIMCR